MKKKTGKTFKPRLDVIEKMQEFVKTSVSGKDLDTKRLMQIDLLVEELAVNIIKYGCKGNPDGQITINIETAPLETVLEFQDNGIAFNPLKQAAPDISAGIENRRPGGLGIFLVKKLTEKIDYERVDDKNIIRLHLAF